jgi:2-polyprenyl-3-methyl-5-hydroxy-6-metoxy-1,4-benzoquinol methylase
MGRYRVESLVGESPEAFQERIVGFLQLEDASMEGYEDPSKQRDLSIRFRWGHDHDFGAFRLRGQMEDRHLWLLSTFMERFGALPRDLTGKSVLDIGCWTGGTSLLLAAMGAEVMAIEEVRKYVDALTYVRDAFGLKNLEPRNLSLYDCSGPEFQDRFDYVLYAGVLYHVTDPVLSLRIVFDSLRDGGTSLIETAAIPARGAMVRYEGPRVFGTGDAKSLTRSGWNWFVPSTGALEQMIRDVGFADVRVPPKLTKNKRAFAVARRAEHVDMLRAGLSTPGIR